MAVPCKFARPRRIPTDGLGAARGPTRPIARPLRHGVRRPCWAPGTARRSRRAPADCARRAVRRRASAHRLRLAGGAAALCGRTPRSRRSRGPRGARLCRRARCLCRSSGHTRSRTGRRRRARRCRACGRRRKRRGHKGGVRDPVAPVSARGVHVGGPPARAGRMGAPARRVGRGG